MSKAVKERRAAQRQVLTINKLAHGVHTMKQQQAKNDPIEKARQAFLQGQRFVSYNNLYSNN